jgi:periplasmic protein CpxP/Spy
MKKLLFIYTLGLGLILNANAQQERKTERPERTPEVQAQRMTDRMAEKLELNETQKKEIYDIQLQQAKVRIAKREEMREEMQASRASHHEKIASVLSPEQKQKWEEMQQESRSKQSAWREGGRKRPEGPSNRRGGGPNRGSRGGGRPA